MAGTRKPTGYKKLEDFNMISASENGWRLKASCNKKEVDTSWFFSPHKSLEARKALLICHSCPVKSDCLYNAIMYQYHGIWGGFTQEARNKIITLYLGNNLTNFTLESAKRIYDEVDSTGIKVSISINSSRKKQ